MKFKFETPLRSREVIKATIHKDGKLGFSVPAAKLLNLEVQRRFLVATNEEDQDDPSIYLIPAMEDRSFKISKSGAYYYMRMDHVFGKFGYKAGAKFSIKYNEKENYYQLSETRKCFRSRTPS